MLDPCALDKWPGAASPADAAAQSRPGERRSRDATEGAPEHAAHYARSLRISQVNATAATAPSTGNPSRTAMSERHSGSRRRRYFGRRRLTTAAESQKSGEDDPAAEVPHFASLL